MAGRGLWPSGWRSRHVATRWGVDHFTGGVPLEDRAEQDFAWQEGWEYRVGQPAYLTRRLLLSPAKTIASPASRTTGPMIAHSVAPVIKLPLM
jgi:hypothetical protein